MVVQIRQLHKNAKGEKIKNKKLKIKSFLIFGGNFLIELVEKFTMQIRTGESKNMKV